MDFLVPEGKIATLPQGYMVGQVADNFGQQVSQRNFNCLINVDTAEIEKEEKNYQSIPNIYNFDNINDLLENNRNQICNDIVRILRDTT
jgi:hypothetical protein